MIAVWKIHLTTIENGKVGQMAFRIGSTAAGIPERKLAEAAYTGTLFAFAVDGK